MAKISGAQAKYGGISSEAVAAKTGKTWEEWIELLDAAGAQDMEHQAIVALLVERGVPDWWCQMVAVGYEQARGKRAKHETPEGFQASASKTIAVPIDALYQAWTDEVLRRRWLPDATLQITTATPNKSVRIKWGDGTRVDVNLYAKGEGKATVQLQHERLPDAAAVERAKAFWKERLEALGRLLAGQAAHKAT